MSPPASHSVEVMGTAPGPRLPCTEETFSRPLDLTGLTCLLYGVGMVVPALGSQLSRGGWAPRARGAEAGLSPWHRAVPERPQQVSVTAPVIDAGENGL